MTSANSDPSHYSFGPSRPAQNGPAQFDSAQFDTAAQTTTQASTTETLVVLARDPSSSTSSAGFDTDNGTLGSSESKVVGPVRSWLLGCLVGLLVLVTLLIGIVTFTAAALILAVVFAVTSVIRLFLVRGRTSQSAPRPFTDHNQDRVLVIGDVDRLA